MNIGTAKPELFLLLDPKLVRSIATMASQHFNLVPAVNESTAVHLLTERTGIAAAMVSVSGDKFNGLKILELVRHQRPEVRRVLFAEPHELAATIQGLHSGVVQYLVHHPIRPTELFYALGVGAGVNISSAASQQQRLSA